MDIALEFVDTIIADHAYAYLFPVAYSNKTDINVSTTTMESLLARDNPYRQFVTIFFISWFFAIAFYFTFATSFYHLIFDKRNMKHPKFLENQIWLEIKATNKSMPFIAVLITPFLLLKVQGFGKLYDTIPDGPGWWYNILQIPLFLLYIDFCLYWIHRFAHHPRVYKHPLYMHNLHHRFFIPTPYSSYAIHPIEGFALLFPYLTLPFIFSCQKIIYFGLCIFGSVWVIGIHEGEFLSNNPIINGAAGHSLHHTHSNCNYGQFFTIFDRIHGTYREYQSKYKGNKDLKE